MTHNFIFFDLDGVLIDNTKFEKEIIRYLTIAHSQLNNIAFLDSSKIINKLLNQKLNNRDDYRYDTFCLSLGLTDVDWMKAHELSLKNLKHFPGTIKFLKNIGKYANLVIVTDATRWVLNFKTSKSKLSNIDFITFSQDDCQSFKGETKYWEILLYNKLKISQFEKSKFIYIDNRLERLNFVNRNYSFIKCIHFDKKEYLQYFEPASSTILQPTIESTNNFKDLLINIQKIVV